MGRQRLSLDRASHEAARLLAAPWAVLLLLLLAVGGAIVASVYFPVPPPPPPAPPAKATPVPETPKPAPSPLKPVPAPLATNTAPEAPVAGETPLPQVSFAVSSAPVPVAAPKVASAAPPKVVPATPPANPKESVTVEVKPDGSIVEGPLATNEELYKEVKHLQQKFDDLQEVLNLMITQMMTDVEHENTQLRAELKRLQARDEAGLLASHPIPRPGVEILEQLAEQVRDDPPDPDAPEDQTPLPPAAFSFRVLKEWGRDADAVKQLGGKAPTLKGVVGVVPLGAAREDVEALGRELRAKYADYDNINVEVFDDPVAAQTYVDTQTMQPEHRVLSVSKYGATNRDAIMYFEDGASSEVADAPASATGPAPDDNGMPDGQGDPAPDAGNDAAPQEEGPHLTQTTLTPPEPTEEQKAEIKKQQSKHSVGKKRRSGK